MQQDDFTLKTDQQKVCTYILTKKKKKIKYSTELKTQLKTQRKKSVSRFKYRLKSIRYSMKPVINVTCLLIFGLLS